MNSERFPSALVLTVLWTAAVGIGCRGDPVQGPTESAETITLDRTSVTVAVREYVKVNPVFRDAAGRVLISVPGIEWTSSNSAIASVDSAGNVTGVAFGGPVRIGVSLHEGVSASLDVHVRPLPSAPSFAAIGLDSVRTLSVDLKDYLGAIVSSTVPKWTSANPDIVTILADGSLHGVRTGTTTVTATYAGTALATSMEVGIPSTFDGLWRGTNSTANSVTLHVLFGSVRRFASSLTFFGGCTVPYIADGLFPIAGNALSLVLPYQSSAAGVFVDSTLTISLSAIAPHADDLRPWCPLIAQAFPIPPSTLHMVRDVAHASGALDRR